MNYYMPYFNMYPNMMAPAVFPSASKGIFSRLFGRGINWGSILNTTQKTLGFVNQAIPVVKQVTPMMKNAKTIFKVMNEFKREDSPIGTEPSHIQDEKKEHVNQMTNVSKTKNVNGGPTFFIN